MTTAIHDGFHHIVEDMMHISITQKVFPGFHSPLESPPYVSRYHALVGPTTNTNTPTSPPICVYIRDTLPLDEAIGGWCPIHYNSVEG